MTLTVENGSFAYPKGPQIFSDISFEVGSGEILAILGPNGAGKTTMLRCVTGMLRWKSGRSLLDGENIRTMSPSKHWRKMAYVPQARAASSAYTAFQTVLLGRSSRIGALSSPKKEDLEAARRAMERLGIEHLAEKSCAAVSGGELQMILIARALASEPELLILDEPESNLDFRNQLVVLDTVSRLAEEGMACVFNTHYPAHALQRAHKSLILSKGGSCVFGPTGKVITEENIRSAFGVNAMIGEIETPESTLRSVMPLSLAGDNGGSRNGSNGNGSYGNGNNGNGSSGSEGDTGNDMPAGSQGDDRVIAAVTTIADSNDMADRINGLLHEYSPLVIGRMGMPHRECGLYIIYTAVDGPEDDIRELTHRLGLLPGVHVKTTQWKP